LGRVFNSKLGHIATLHSYGMRAGTSRVENSAQSLFCQLKLVHARSKSRSEILEHICLLLFHFKVENIAPKYNDMTYKQVSISNTLVLGLGG
jgi:hypothetical protein